MMEGAPVEGAPRLFAIMALVADICASHGVETRLHCASCGKPICLRCQVRTEVGIKCPDCAALPASALRRRRAGAGGVMGAGLAVVLVVALLGIHPWTGGQSAAPATGSPVGAWRSLADLKGIRGSSAAVVLQDNRVLVVGGGVGSIPLAAAELIDPVRGTDTQVAPMQVARRGHAAVLLKDGRVLVAGGLAGGRVLSDAEIFDASRGAWQEIAPMHVARFNHTLTMLADGRVLAAGGASPVTGPGGFNAEQSAEIFDPHEGTWTTVSGGLLTPRYDAVAVLLQDGRVLVAGGIGPGASAPALDSAELFDPAVRVFTRTGSMNQARQDLTGTLLGNGRVLVAGGSSGDVTRTTAELFDPSRGTWLLTGSLEQGRRLHAASLLSDGRVLVTGGEVVQVGSRSSLKSAEIYDPAGGKWRGAAPMTCPRSAQVQVTAGSVVVVAAGDAAFPGEPPRAQSCVEVFRA